jgi:UDP-glucose 4-epimerase
MLGGKRPAVFGDGYQARDFTFVGDVVEGNLLAADAPGVSGRVFNVATGHQVNLLELLAALNRLLKTSVEPIFAPPRAGDVRESLADITLARQHLNYEPQVRFEEGLRRSIDYYCGLVAKRG